MSRTKRKHRHPKATPVKAGDGSVAISGSVANSNIFIGNNNQIIQQIVERQLVVSLFTIPAPVVDFTGREKELADLKASFERGAIVTGVTGGGGIGKTELVRKLAQELAGKYPDARMSIDLLGTSEKPLTAEEAMHRLLEPFYPNQKLPDEPEQLKGLFQQTFAAQKALLLLDNAADAGQVRPLIPPAPSAAIVTSRQHFSISEFGLNPLRLNTLLKQEAAQLLRTSSEKLHEVIDGDVFELARLCGYLPLALRVVTSLLNDRPDWTAKSLCKRLADEKTRLQRLKRENDLDVEAAISLSYQNLDNGLKLLFRQLSVFTSPFIRDSARAVWDIENEEFADEVLGKLINRNLLSVLPLTMRDLRNDASIPLYSFHDLTRIYAAQRLAESEVEMRECIIRHAGHFLLWAERVNDLYLEGNEKIRLSLVNFRFIWPHLLAAYSRFLPGQVLVQSEIADSWLSAFPSACIYPSRILLPASQAIPIFQSAVDASRRLGDVKSERIHRSNLGIYYYLSGEIKKAIDAFEHGLSVSRENNDRRGEGANLGNLGNAFMELGDVEKSIKYFEEALIISREIGELRDEGSALGSLGNAWLALNNPKKAIEYLKLSLKLHKKIGEKYDEGTDLDNLGNAHRALGKMDLAINFYKRALLIAQKIDDVDNQRKRLAAIRYIQSLKFKR